MDYKYTKAITQIINKSKQATQTINKPKQVTRIT